MEAHAKSMAAVEEVEAQWKVQLQVASAELAKLSDQKAAEELEDDANMETSRASDAIAEVSKTEQLMQQQQLLSSLREASMAAANMATAVKREWSRTPRRKRPVEHMTVESFPELGKDGEVEAKLAAPLDALAKAPPGQPFK